MKRSRKIADENVTGNYHFTADVSYLMGGTNWFHGTTFPRGYYVTVMVVEREPASPGSAFRFERLILGNGFKKLLREAQRFSAKTLNEIEVPAGLLDEMRERALQQAHLTVVRP